MRRRIASSLIVLLFVCSAGTESASPKTVRLDGTIFSIESEKPVAGGRVHLGDRRTGRILSSGSSDDDGSFRLDDVPPGTWEVAVESAGGLYLVASPIVLEPGKQQTVHLQIGHSATPGPRAIELSAPDGSASIWNNPTTAALIVVGAAIAAGLLIDAATDDNDLPVSPSDG